MQDLEKRISETKKRLAKDFRLRERLKELESEGKTITRRILALQRIVEREWEDIRKLERININALFNKILGNFEQQMDQEKQEYLEACLNFSALIREKELWEYEITLLSKMLIDRNHLLAQLDELFIEKEMELRSQNNSISRRLQEFDKQIGQLKLKSYRIKKAIELGQKAEEHIKSIQSELLNVSNWGFRELTGEGFIALQKRHRFVENALKKAVEAQRVLNEFSTKIESVYPNSKPHLHLNQFKIFVQTLVHHLVSDWIVERRIKMAIQGIEIALDQVTLYLFNLNHEMDSCSKKIEILVEEKNLYVENL